MKNPRLLDFARSFKWHATRTFDPTYLSINQTASHVNEFLQYIKTEVAQRLGMCLEPIMDYEEIRASPFPYQNGYKGSCYILNEKQMISLIQFIEEETEKALQK